MMMLRHQSGLEQSLQNNSVLGNGSTGHSSGDGPDINVVLRNIDGEIERDRPNATPNRRSMVDDGHPQRRQVAKRKRAAKKTEATAPRVRPGKRTRGRVKIETKFIKDKAKRYATFSKRKIGLMKKAYELAMLTGTQVLLLAVSETGHVYTNTTHKLQPMITSEEGKALMQTCFNSPDPPADYDLSTDVRISNKGFEEADMTFQVSGSEILERIRGNTRSSAQSVVPTASSTAMQMTYLSTVPSYTNFAEQLPCDFTITPYPPGAVMMYNNPSTVLYSSNTGQYGADGGFAMHNAYSQDGPFALQMSHAQANNMDAIPQVYVTAQPEPVQNPVSEMQENPTVSDGQQLSGSSSSNLVELQPVNATTQNLCNGEGPNWNSVIPCTMSW